MKVLKFIRVVAGTHKSRAGPFHKLFLQQEVEFPSALGRNMRHGLVQEDPGRPRKEAVGHKQALELATRERAVHIHGHVQPLIRKLRQSNSFQRSLHSPIAVLIWPLREGDGLSDGHGQRQAWLLRYQYHISAAGSRFPHQLHVGPQACKGAEEGRLASALLAAYQNHVSWTNLQMQLSKQQLSRREFYGIGVQLQCRCWRCRDVNTWLLLARSAPKDHRPARWNPFPGQPLNQRIIPKPVVLSLRFLHQVSHAAHTEVV
mmetsp:Transcript_9428/g.22693  ORF Transcript_9428/g.22693 Transcript_9428/m.22693 type:complete len:260 (+) Transcript_9428:192-971(+)